MSCDSEYVVAPILLIYIDIYGMWVVFRRNSVRRRKGVIRI